jgi:AcrR family transcriptional regulator
MKRSYLTRREVITLTAIDIISELGIHELSVREIAKRQGITDAALYKHFKSKQEIILEVLDYYSKFDENIMNTIDSSDMNSREGIIFFVKELSEYHENYHELIAIEHSYEIFQHEVEIGEKLRNIFIRRTDFLKRLIANGKISKEFSDSINEDYVSDIIVGIFREGSMKWRMSGYSYSLKERIFDILVFFLDRIKGTV